MSSLQRIAALDAEYAPTVGYVSHAAMDPTFAIVPAFRARKCGRNARVTLMVPKTLVVNCFA